MKTTSIIKYAGIIILSGITAAAYFVIFVVAILMLEYHTIFGLSLVP